MLDDVKNNDRTADMSNDQKGGLSMLVWIIIAVLGFVVIKNLFGTDYSSPDAELNEFDEDTIDSVLTADDGLPYPFPDDNTPQVIEVPGGDLTDAEVIAMTAQLYDRYSGIADRIALKLQTDAANVFDITVLIAASGSGGVYTEKGLDLYFRALEVWAPRWANTITSIANATATIAGDLFDSVNAATHCVDTVMVISAMTQETYQTDKTSYTVQINNGSKGGFMGLSKKKSSSENRTSVRELTRLDTKAVTYTPVCQQWQLSPTELDALLATQSLANQNLSALAALELASAPNPKQFILPSGMVAGRTAKSSK